MQIAPVEAICMKRQILFSGKSKTYFKLLYDENFTQSAKR